MNCEGANVTLPEGVSVIVGGRTYRGECPERFCPPKFFEKSVEKKSLRKKDYNKIDASNKDV